MTQNRTIDTIQEIYLSHLNTLNGIKFTRREMDVMACTLSGKSSKAIADILDISFRTVETHIYRVMQKLKYSSREELIQFIERSGHFSLVHTYYRHLLKQHVFEKGIHKLSEEIRKKNFSCTISYWKSKETPGDLIEYLEKDLTRASIKASIDIKKDKIHIKDLEQDFSSPSLKVYIGSRETIEKVYNTFKKQEDFSQENKVNSNMVFVSLEESLSYPQCINYGNSKSYHDFFINLLSFILPNVKIMEIFKELSASDSINTSDVPEDFPQANLTQEKLLAKKISDLPKKIKTYSFLPKNKKSIFMVFSAVAALFLLIILSNLKIYSKFDSSIRSDLPMPKETILLKRAQLLREITKKLEGDQIEIVALVGIGGAGKTTLSRQYASSQKISLVWEINAESKTSLANSFKNLAYALAKTDEQKKELDFIQEIQNSEGKQLIGFIQNRLKEMQNWLLIYDNVETLSDIKDYLPHDPKVWGVGKIILTTRNENIKNTSTINSENVIYINELDKDEKLSLFSKIFYNVDYHELTKEQKEKIVSFLENIPSFPLDISTAAYYIKNTDITYDEYLERIKESSVHFGEAQERLLQEMSDYTNTRYGIITVSLQQLIKENPEFKEILFWICMLDSQKISKTLLEFSKDHLVVDDFIRQLKKHSLITSESLGSQESNFKTFSLHRSTQAIGLAFLLKILTEKEKEAFLQHLVLTLKSLQEQSLEENCAHISGIISHLEALKGNIKNSKILARQQSKFLGEILLILGHANFKCTGNSVMAKEYFLQGLNINKSSSYVSDKALATVFKDLGGIYAYSGSLQQGLDYFKKSIELCKKIKNSEILIAANFDFMGVAYSQKNNFKEAKACFEKGLEALKKADPQKRKWIEALIYKHLAWLYSKTYLGRKEAYEAEKFDLKALDLIGASHSFYDNRMKYKGQKSQEKLLYEAVRHKEGLGYVYCRLGKYKEAKKVFEDAEYIMNHLISDYSHHSMKRHIALGMGEILLREGKLKEAENKLAEAIQISDKLFGLNCSFQIEKAYIVEAKIRQDKLEEAYQDCLSLFKLEKRITHPYSNLMYLTSLYHAAIIKYKQGDFKKSSEHFSNFFKQIKLFCKGFLDDNEYKSLEAKGVFEEVLPSEMSSRNSLKKYLNHSIEIFSAIYGKSHPFVTDYVIQN